MFCNFKKIFSAGDVYITDIDTYVNKENYRENKKYSLFLKNAEKVIDQPQSQSHLDGRRKKKNKEIVDPPQSSLLDHGRWVTRNEENVVEPPQSPSLLDGRWRKKNKEIVDPPQSPSLLDRGRWVRRN